MTVAPILIVEPAGRRLLCSAVVACAVMSGACGRPLSPAAVDRSVAEHFNADGIRIETIAVTRISGREAHARTRIGSGVFDLRFRREGWSAWTWESGRVDETGWLPADRFVAHVHEQARQARIRDWARTIAADYTTTIRRVDEYSDFLPAVAASPFTKTEWMSGRHEMAETLRHATRILNLPPMEQQRQRLAADRLEQGATDAWNEAVAVSFDAPRRQAVFVSGGPDRVPGSPDDIVCTVTGSLTQDPSLGASRWTYRKEWRVPEGLQAALNDAVALPRNRHVTFTRLVE